MTTGLRPKETGRSLPALIQQLVAIGDPDELVAKSLHICREFIGADEVSLLLVEGDELVEHVVEGRTLRKAGFRTKIGKAGLTGWCAGKRKTVIVADVKKDKRFVPVSGGMRSEADVPLLAGDRLMGVLNFESSRAGYFRPQDRSLLEMLGSQIEIGLALEEQNRRAARLSMQLGMLSHLGRAGTSLEGRDYLQRVVDGVRRAFDCAAVAVFVDDEERKQLVLAAKSSTLQGGKAPGSSRPYKGGMVGESCRLGETINVRDVRKEKNYEGCFPDVRSELDVPILAGERCLGLIDAQSTTAAAFTEDEVQTLETLARFLVPVVQGRKARDLVAG